MSEVKIYSKNQIHILVDIFIIHLILMIGFNLKSQNNIGNAMIVMTLKYRKIYRPVLA